MRKYPSYILQLAHDVLHRVKLHPEAYKIVDNILTDSEVQNCKFFALTLLENAVKKQWRKPGFDADGVRRYVVALLDKISRLPESTSTERTFMTKLNEILILIVREEWPHNWPNFIMELVHQAKQNQFLCENNLRILATLSEDIFEYGEKNIVGQFDEILMWAGRKERGVLLVGSWICVFPSRHVLLRNQTLVLIYALFFPRPRGA